MNADHLNPIPWWSPQMTGLEADFLHEVLQSNYVNEGAVTERFETQLADLLGARHAIAVTSGTVALFLALKALGVGAGDEVIVPDLTFIATANAVHLTAATPVLADVEADTLGISLEAVEKKITPRTRAVVPVHISGRAVRMAPLLELAAHRRLHVVEDAAEALLSRQEGRCLGTWGRAGCFSFSPNKTITTGQGGLIVTDDPELVGRLRQLKDQGRPSRGTGGDDHHPVLGFNFKFTNLQAAVGLAQLTVLPDRVDRLRAIYRTYASRLGGLPGLRLPGFDLPGGETPQWIDAVIDNRDGLDSWLRSRRIECRRFWHPLHTQPPYRLSDSAFPAASRVGRQALWLPSAFQMTDEQQLRVCTAIAEFLHVH